MRSRNVIVCLGGFSLIVVSAIFLGVRSRTTKVMDSLSQSLGTFSDGNTAVAPMQSRPDDVLKTSVVVDIDHSNMESTGHPTGIGDLDLPQFDYEEEAFRKWETATYAPINEGGALALVNMIPVSLEAEIEEEVFSKLQERIAEMLMLYKTRDPERYISMFTKGGASPQSERVERYRGWLHENGSDISREDLNNPLDVYRERVRVREEMWPGNGWEALAVSESECKIYGAAGFHTLRPHLELMPRKGSLISTHLQWDYPVTTQQLMRIEGSVKYAGVRLLVQHTNSEERFPLTFLFYWDSKLDTWRLKEGYASFGKNTENRIFM